MVPAEAENFRKQNGRNKNETEENIDNLRKLMVDHHFERLNRGECVPTSSGVFVNLVNNLERSADHMMYVVENVQLALENSKKNFLAVFDYNILKNINVERSGISAP